MQLRNPDFGNSYEVSPNVVIRLSVDGDVRKATFNRPTVKRQTLSFSALTLTQKEGLVSFLRANAGKAFSWHTHIGTVIKVIITDDEVTFTQRGVGCMYATSFTVEEVP